MWARVPWILLTLLRKEARVANEETFLVAKINNPRRHHSQSLTDYRR
jgi:hypothetical protein